MFRHHLFVQLSQVVTSLESAAADTKDDLIQLQTDLQQLIQLTEGLSISSPLTKTVQFCLHYVLDCLVSTDFSRTRTWCLKTSIRTRTRDLRTRTNT